MRLPILCIIVGFLWLLSGCKGGSKSGQHNKENSSVAKDSLNSEAVEKPKSAYKIYIENSGSMDGYISQPTQFKEVLIKFLSDIPTHLQENPSLYFVNKVACQQLPNQPTSELVHFVQNLNPKISKKDCVPSGNSLIDDVIDLCTKDTGNTVNVVVSDCIFSLNKNGITALPVAEADIKMSMKKKLDSLQLSTVVLKYNSDFSGSYYAESKGGVPIPLLHAKRPFYIMIFGKENVLAELMSKVNFQSYPGFEASYCLISGLRKKILASSVTSQNRIGTFTSEKPASRMMISGANPNVNKGNLFQFSINVDFNKLGFEESYLLDTSNYIVNENFKVISVSKISDQSRYTHNIVLRTSQLKQSSNLEVGLTYDIPKWVLNTGNVVDDDPKDPLQQTQTFGFKYLMSGISSAYIAKNASQFQFTIPIKISMNTAGSNGSSSSFSWWLIVLLLVIVSILIWLKNKK